MAAISVGTDIKPLQGAIVRRGTLGASTTKGYPVTLQSDGYWDPTNTTTNAQLTIAVAVQGGSEGDRVDLVRYGPIQCISGATIGSLVYGADATGYDTAVGAKDTVIGYAESATVLFVKPQIIDFS